jgi:hypothetical protein
MSEAQHGGDRAPREGADDPVWQGTREVGGTTRAGTATGLAPQPGQVGRNDGMYDLTPDDRVSPDPGVCEMVAAR